MKKLSILLLLLPLIAAIFSADLRFNQMPDVLRLTEAQRQTDLALHMHIYDNLSIRIADLEAVENPSESQRVMLSFYTSQREKILNVLEKIKE